LAGDVVLVRDGSYPADTLVAHALGSPAVSFWAEAGAKPTFDSVMVQTSYVELVGLAVPHSLTATSVGIWSVAPPSDGAHNPSDVSYVTLRNDEGGELFIVGEHVDVLGGIYGGFDSCLTGEEDLTRIWQMTGTDGMPHASSYVTIDGVTIHDGTDHGDLCGSASGPHVDGMQILGGHYITIRRSFFYNCPTSCIIGSGYLTGEDHYLIENNFLQQEAEPGATLNFSYSANGDPPTGVGMVIRNNTTNGSISVGCVAGSAGCWDVYGNVSGGMYCGPMATTSYNVVGDGNCIANGGKQGTPSFVGPTPQSSFGSTIIPDFHLSPSDTVAIAAGDPTRFPSVDYDGQPRPSPAGTAPEAGADER
jgi:hypothetical protein